MQMLRSAAAIFRPLDLCRPERAAKGDAVTGTIGFDRRWRPSDRAAAGRQGARLSLSEFPEIGALVESMRATLAGDPATLDRFYVPTLTGTADDWSLQLEPRDPRLRKIVALIRIQGDGTSIRTVETLETDGDRTEMTITPDLG